MIRNYLIIFANSLTILILIIFYNICLKNNLIVWFYVFLIGIMLELKSKFILT